jgi:hypothetical protein
VPGFSNEIIFYACENDVLLLDDSLIDKYLLKINREELLATWEKIGSRRQHNPLSPFNAYLDDFTPETRENLLKELSEILKIPSPALSEMTLKDVKK